MNKSITQATQNDLTSRFQNLSRDFLQGCYCSLRSQQHALRCTQNAFSMHFGACKSRKIAFHAILASRNMDCEQ